MSSAAPQRLDSLTGLRGVFSTTVFVGHVAASWIFAYEFSKVMLGIIVGPGQAAVGWFFMTSGFVLVWIARPHEKPRDFFRRRIAKIFPNHLVTWGAGAVLLYTLGTWTGWKVLPSLVLVHAWIPLPAVLINVDGPNWSLSNEAFFYLLFPLTLVWVRRIRPERLYAWVIALVGIIWAWTIFVAVVLPSGDKIWGLVPSVPFYFLMWFPPARLPEFLLGMIIARMVMEGQWKRVHGGWTVGLLLAAWALSLVIPRPFGFVAPFLPGMVLMTGNAAVADLSGVKQRFAKPWLVWLGDRSFAFYLIHLLVLTYALRLFGPEPERFGPGLWAWPLGLLYVLACLAVSIYLAHLLHTKVELPAMRKWGRAARAPKSAAPTEVTATEVSATDVAAAEAAKAQVDDVPSPQGEPAR
ncbi:acyltransferase family protein [Spongisporangium articulatum]|uniref:Acyltransferase family protein n=1 Tax=Spongisporangium articulatum TaxID=3362603 RepID=A0ABW8AKL0_9ACTN